MLAKLDTDANPQLAQAFGIQGIPAVKAFKDGQVVDEFVGAQPPAAVERFFDGLVPCEADALVAAGDEASLRRALELQPGRADAAVALARLLHRRGERGRGAGAARRRPAAPSRPTAWRRASGSSAPTTSSPMPSRRSTTATRARPSTC